MGVQRTLQRAATMLASLVWIGGWLHVARGRYAAQRVCELAAGPWLPCGPYDWQAPLALALTGAAGLLLAFAARHHGLPR